MGDRPGSGTLRRGRVRQPERPHRSPDLGRCDLTRLAAVTATILLTATAASAQQLSIWLDGSTSHARPPAGVTGEPTQYGLFGLRVATDLDWGRAAVGGRVGSALAGAQGRWLQGDLAVSTGARLGPVGLRATPSVFGLHYLDPFAYDAIGLDLTGGLSYPAGATVIAVTPRLSLGRWSAETVEGGLRVAGGDLEVRRAFGALSAAASAGALAVDNGAAAGAFLRAGAEVGLDRGQWRVLARVNAQRTPLELELGGGLFVALSAAPGVEANAYVGRTVRDPRFGTAGSFGLSLGVSARPVRWSAPPPPAVAAIGEHRGVGRVVRFAIRAAEAETVALTGDFTGWEPIPMEESGGGWWRLSRVVPAGVQHFGFLVDGQWAIPADAPGVVEDGWGRRNASIVVEP